MNFRESIESDARTLTRYFEKLFELLEGELELLKISRTKTLSEANEMHFHTFVDYIKPDMLLNIYGFWEFWIQRICEYYKSVKKLELDVRDIKGNSDLQVYDKYLDKYVGLDLSGTRNSYSHLDALRRVRNRIIHHGGYAPTDQGELAQFKKIEGVEMLHGLVHIRHEYVWASLREAKEYLLGTLPTNLK